MRRAVLTLGGTAAGLAALLSYKSHPATTEASAASTPSTPSSPSTPSTPSTSGTRSAPPAAGERTVTGAVADTQYGPMQVRLTLSGRRITNVTVAQRTDSGEESDQIDSFAIPKLNSETLAAQSARIDAVSGASYTSSGYIKSLQSALDQVRA